MENIENDPKSQILEVEGRHAYNCKHKNKINVTMVKYNIQYMNMFNIFCKMERERERERENERKKLQ